MVEFPVIEAGQVALLKADTRTGHVLAVDNSVFISDGKKVYTIFRNLEEAEKHVSEDRVVNDWIEYHIYNHNQHPLLLVEPNFPGKPNRPKGWHFLKKTFWQYI